jgi:aspartyl-tRNA(Asn)/glutamyl-tRNA(Gln) amidotransferase subunit C
MTKLEVTKLATLARLEVTPEEVEIYAKQLTSILEYVSQLNQVDTQDVLPTLQVGGLVNVFREDIVEESKIHDKLLEQAGCVSEGGVKVKNVF